MTKTRVPKRTTSATDVSLVEDDDGALPFRDVSAERAVIAGILQHGNDSFLDASEYVDPAHFSNEFNQVLFSCIKDYYEDGNDGKIDWSSLLSVAKKNHLAHIIETQEAKKHISALMKFKVEESTVRKEAAKLLKLYVGKELYSVTKESGRILKDITGDESLNVILSLIEHPILEFTSKLGGNDLDGPIHISAGGDEWLEYTLEHPTDNIGIPSPFTVYNEWIGGGFRRKSISIIGARPKSGKTVMCDNVALHVAGKLGIPVLNLDTEMTQEEHLARILAHLTGIPIGNIERGKVNDEEKKKLREKMKWLKTIPYYYQSVIDKTFEEQMAAMRRWCVKVVGYDENQQVKDALIVYDYLQLTDPGEFKGDFKEYQLLGFQMVALHRLSKRCDVPVLSMLQLNRDGIDKETTAVAAGSDRIIWKCANFSILKRKDAEEIEEDGRENGNLKLINLISRHGEGSQSGDWLNLIFDGKTACLKEGPTNFNVRKNSKSKSDKGFEVDENEEFDQDQEF